MASAPDPSLFDPQRLTGRLFLDGENLTIFNYSLSTADLFSQGEWDLIRRDLEYAGVCQSSIETLEEGPCAEIIQAFRIRRELIHYKKVCLHLVQESKTNERDLKQATAFFHWHDKDDEEKQNGAQAHLEAIRKLLPLDFENDVRPIDLEAISVAMEKHAENACELVNRKIMHVLATDVLSFNRGLSLAIQDARNIVKQICRSPRHMGGTRPAKLRDLPNSLHIFQALKRACSDFDLEYNCENDDETLNPNSQLQTETCIIGTVSMSRIIAKVKNQLQWPKEAIDFLSMSIHARGGFKALAMMEELKNYSMHFQKLVGHLKNILMHLRRDHSLMIELTLERGELPVKAKLILPPKAVARVNKIHHLRGISKVVLENAKWISVLAGLLDKRSSTERLFMASDTSSANDKRMFVPKQFEMGRFIASSRNVLDQILLPTMMLAISLESWPPTLGTRRTRVLAFDNSRLEEMASIKKKLETCKICKGHFATELWIRHKLCMVCENTRRNKANRSECLFEDCQFGDKAFCSHFQRCFVCDAPHSCDKFCQLSRGDGEVALGMVETIRPNLLLLDFDRTLATTKSGASPLPKSGHKHSIDEELKNAVIAQQAFGKSHVVTRNSNKADIQEFLLQHGLDGLAQNVHVVPKKKTKGFYIRETFYTDMPEQDTVCIFIDDSLPELVKDPWLRSTKAIHRLLFVRCLL